MAERALGKRLPKGAEAPLNYILRNIDEALWRQFKAHAALEGMSLKALLEQFIRDWLRGRGVAL